MEPQTYTVFAHDQVVASGEVETILRYTKAAVDRGEFDGWLIFDDATGDQIDFDFRGTIEQVLARLPHHPAFAADVPPPAHSGPGRPKLGVVSREVSLLPRHWEWLEQQPNGISSALRRLVDDARKANAGKDRARTAAESAGRFMTAMAGNLPGFEEALRALYAHNEERFEKEIHGWPNDIRDYARRLATASFSSAPAHPAPGT